MWNNTVQSCTETVLFFVICVTCTAVPVRVVHYVKWDIRIVLFFVLHVKWDSRIVLFFVLHMKWDSRLLQRDNSVLCVTYEMRQQTIAERHSCSLCFMYCSTYEGDVVQGKRHGHGTFRWKDNTMSYTGDWVQGLRTGKVSVVENL